MKTVNFFKKTATALVLAAISYTGYASTPKTMTMTMTTSMQGKVQFTLAGTGTAVIDWGDGSIPKTVALSAFAGEFTDAQRYAHTFSGTNSRTIAINGQNITHLECAKSRLTALEVSKNTGLKHLDCFGNGLTSLDVTKNTALTYLSCGGNELMSIDVSKNTALTYLECGQNELTALDVSKNTGLTDLYCYTTPLTTIDVSKNTALTGLFCYFGQFTVEGLNALFGTLPGNANGKKLIDITGNPGTAGCNKSIATGKGWTVNTTTQ